MKQWLDQLSQVAPTLSTIDQVISWQQLMERVHQRIEAYRNFGLRKGDIVAANGSKVWLVESWLACLQLELVFCPVPKNYGHSAFVQPEVPHSHKQESHRILWHGESGPGLISHHIFPEWSFLTQMHLPCLLLRTSGTSGQNRWVAYEADRVQRQIYTHAHALKKYSGFDRLQLLPLYHTFGLVLDLSLGMQLGQRVHLVEPQHLMTASWLRLAQTKVWDMALTPRLAHVLCQYGQASHGLLHVGGARVSDKLHEQASKQFKHVIEGYGLTECGPGVLLEGQPLDCQVQLDLIKGIGDGQLGVLKVKSPTMGVWQNSADEISSGWYTTQDLAIHNAKGYSVIGRLNRCLKRSDGRWVWLDELESTWEQSLSLNALHIGLTDQSKLQMILLDCDEAAMSQLEKWAKKLFDLPITFKITPSFQLVQSISKSILAG